MSETTTKSEVQSTLEHLPVLEVDIQERDRWDNRGQLLKVVEIAEIITLHNLRDRIGNERSDLFYVIGRDDSTERIYVSRTSFDHHPDGTVLVSFGDYLEVDWISAYNPQSRKI